MAAPLADADDVAARWRPLSDAERTVADTLCGDASARLRARFPGIDAQATSGQVDPDILTMVVASMVKRAMVAPADGQTQESQTVGPYSQSRAFSNPLGNLFITADEVSAILGYQPAGMSVGFGNTTTRRGIEGGFVYGEGFDPCTVTITNP